LLESEREAIHGAAPYLPAGATVGHAVRYTHHGCRICAILPGSVHAKAQYSSELNFKYIGNDIKRVSNVVSSEACMSQCEANAECMHWRYGKRLWQWYTRICSLKRGKPPAGTPDDCCASGLPHQGSIVALRDHPELVRKGYVGELLVEDSAESLRWSGVAWHLPQVLPSTKMPLVVRFSLPTSNWFGNSCKMDLVTQ